MVRSSRAVARVAVTTCEEGSRSYSKSALKQRWLRGRASISLLPVQKSPKRRAAAAISSKAKHASRTAKHAAKKRKVQKDDEVKTQKGQVFQQYHPVSGNLPPESPDSGYVSPEYHPDSDREIPPSRPISPSTEQRLTEKTREKYMSKARQAIEYYHLKHPDDRYAPVDINLQHFLHIIDKEGYYIHMNFTAQDMETKARKIFFAELLLPYFSDDEYHTVTACDIVGPESPGGLRHVYDKNDILFVGDTMDMENCYACDDDMKHPEGNGAYQAGHMGHIAYED